MRNNSWLSKGLINSNKKNENFKQSEKKVYPNEGGFRVHKKKNQNIYKRVLQQETKYNAKYVTEASGLARLQHKFTADGRRPKHVGANSV